MSINATESTAGLFGATPSPTGVPSTSISDEDTFLKLMVAQLKYQDPMNPTDSAEFLSQSAQFSALEQMTTVAEQSAQSIVLQLAFGASSLVGKTVTYVGAEGVETTGTVGSVRFDPTGPVLQVGEVDIGMGDVVTVHSQAPAPGAPLDPAQSPGLLDPTSPLDPVDPANPLDPADPADPLTP